MIEIVIDDARWDRALPGAAKIATRSYDSACAFEPELRGEVALLLTDDGAQARLNQRFRQKEGSTNVLSFPAGDGGGEFLGDLSLAYETCQSEAREKSIALDAHVTHLIVHGLLHLIGYDHQAEDEAAQMEARETAVLASMGVADPYAAETDGE